MGAVGPVEEDRHMVAMVGFPVRDFSPNVLLLRRERAGCEAVHQDGREKRPARGPTPEGCLDLHESPSR